MHACPFCQYIVKLSYQLHSRAPSIHGLAIVKLSELLSSQHFFDRVHVVEVTTGDWQQTPPMRAWNVVQTTIVHCMCKIQLLTAAKDVQVWSSSAM